MIRCRSMLESSLILFNDRIINYFEPSTENISSSIFDRICLHLRGRWILSLDICLNEIEFINDYKIISKWAVKHVTSEVACEARSIKKLRKNARVASWEKQQPAIERLIKSSTMHDTSPADVVGFLSFSFYLSLSPPPLPSHLPPTASNFATSSPSSSSDASRYIRATMSKCNLQRPSTCRVEARCSLYTFTRKLTPRLITCRSIRRSRTRNR